MKNTHLFKSRMTFNFDIIKEFYIEQQKDIEIFTFVFTVLFLCISMNHAPKPKIGWISEQNCVDMITTLS